MSEGNSPTVSHVAKSDLWGRQPAKWGVKLTLCSGGILVQQTTTPSNGWEGSNSSDPLTEPGGDSIAKIVCPQKDLGVPPSMCITTMWKKFLRHSFCFERPTKIWTVARRLPQLRRVQTKRVPRPLGGLLTTNHFSQSPGASKSPLNTRHGCTESQCADKYITITIMNIDDYDYNQCRHSQLYNMMYIVGLILQRESVQCPMLG